MNDDSRRWTSRISSHRGGDMAESRSLLQDSARAIERVSRRYPSVYFELARKTPESVASLSHRVFTRLDVRVFGRFPFSDRTPFDAFVQDDMSDRDVRWHSFDARLSIARETLREQYAFNVRHHPEWAEKEKIHKAVVAALNEHCARWPGRSPRYPRFGLTSWSSGPRSPRQGWDRDEVVRIVARRAGWPLHTRVEMVLAKRGAPMYPGEVSSILQDADVASSDSSLDPELIGDGDRSDTLATQVSVRTLVSERWATLDAEEQHLLALLIDGRPYREVVEVLPRYRDPSAVTRALARICQAFIADIAAALGVAAGGGLKPKQQAELLFGVLVELPEVQRLVAVAR